MGLEAIDPGLLAPGLAHARRLRQAGRLAELATLRGQLTSAAAAHVAASPWRQVFLRGV